MAAAPLLGQLLLLFVILNKILYSNIHCSDLNNMRLAMSSLQNKTIFAIYLKCDLVILPFKLVGQQNILLVIYSFGIFFKHECRHYNMNIYLKLTYIHH